MTRSLKLNSGPEGLQLDPATVIVFPLERRAALIRKTAGTLLVINGKRTDTYWRKVLTGLRKELKIADVAEDLADLQLRAFYQAVQAMMNRLEQAAER